MTQDSRMPEPDHGNLPKFEPTRQPEGQWSVEAQANHHCLPGVAARSEIGPAQRQKAVGFSRASLSRRETREGLSSQLPGADAAFLESAAAIEKDEDHCGTGQSDQGQGSEVGDQMKVDAHDVLLVRVALELNHKVPAPCSRGETAPL